MITLGDSERTVGRAWMLLCALRPEHFTGELKALVAGLGRADADGQGWWRTLRDEPDPTAAQLTAAMLSHPMAEERTHRQRQHQEIERKRQAQLQRLRAQRDALRSRRVSVESRTSLHPGLLFVVAAILMALVGNGVNWLMQARQGEVVIANAQVFVIREPFQLGDHVFRPNVGFLTVVDQSGNPETSPSARVDDYVCVRSSRIFHGCYDLLPYGTVEVRERVRSGVGPTDGQITAAVAWTFVIGVGLIMGMSWLYRRSSGERLAIIRSQEGEIQEQIRRLEQEQRGTL